MRRPRNAAASTLYKCKYAPRAHRPAGPTHAGRVLPREGSAPWPRIPALYRPMVAQTRYPALMLHAQRGALARPHLMSLDAATALVADGAAAAVSSGTTAQEALDNFGRDVLTFLAASVLVVPASRGFKISPVLGFLALGCAIGPYGLALFSNTEADIELGDFGILFLLFIEGLNLSPDRLERLGSFFQLGAAQLLLSIAFFFSAALLIGPQARHVPCERATATRPLIDPRRALGRRSRHAPECG